MGQRHTYKIIGAGKVVIYEIEIHKDTGGSGIKSASATEQLSNTKHSDIFDY